MWLTFTHWAVSRQSLICHLPRIDRDDKVQCGSKANTWWVNTVLGFCIITDHSPLSTQTVTHCELTCEEGKSCEDSQSLLLCLRVVGGHGKPEHQPQGSKHRQHTTLKKQGYRVNTGTSTVAKTIHYFKKSYKVLINYLYKNSDSNYRHVFWPIVRALSEMHLQSCDAQ